MLKSDREKLSTKQPLQNTKQPSNKTKSSRKRNSESYRKSNEENDHYVFPSSQLLIAPESQIEDTEWLESQSNKLEESVSHFGVQATCY